MIAFAFSFLAATCGALTNLFFRKSSEYIKGTENPHFYLLCFYFFSFLFSCSLNPNLWQCSFNFIAFGIGSCVGALNVVLMSLTSHALRQGPAGLTFAFQNASAIFPGLLLFALFGSEWGFYFTYAQLIGIFLVLLGLFIGTKKTKKFTSSTISTWLKYVLAVFVIQILALTLIQGRCILFDCDALEGSFSYLALDQADDAWFMPGQFSAACLLQFFIWLSNKRNVNLTQGIIGFFSGLTNFCSTLLLLLATKAALPNQKVILFPLFAVSTIILCNFWANRIYKEKFNFRTNLLCSMGILLGTMKF